MLKISQYNKTLNDLIKDSKVTTFHTNPNEFIKKLSRLLPENKTFYFYNVPATTMLDEYVFDGMFVYLNKKESVQVNLPRRFILLKKDIHPAERLYTWLHEYKHYLCSKRYCKCWYPEQNSLTLSEYHADFFALKYLYKLQALHALSYCIAKITDGVIYKDTYSYHSDEKLIKTSIWRKIISLKKMKPFLDALKG